MVLNQQIRWLSVTLKWDKENPNNNEKCDHEGYVVSNEYGTYKLINRHQFSYDNFNSDKWNK